MQPDYSQTDTHHRGFDEKNYFLWAIEHLNSNAAKLLKSFPNGLNNQQKEEVANLIGQATSQPPSFLEHIVDSIKAFFSEIANGPSKKGDTFFARVGVRKSEMLAMRTAEKVYNTLVAGHYDLLAQQISGVKPDDKGNLVPIRDKDGKLSGLFAREAEKARDPAYLAYQDRADIGTAPSEKQIARVNAWFKADIEGIYKNPLVMAEMKRYYDGLQNAPAKKEGGKHLSEFITPNLERLVDAIENDPQIARDGAFQYDRQKLLDALKSSVEKGHDQLYTQYLATHPTDTSRVAAAQPNGATVTEPPPAQYTPPLTGGKHKPSARHTS